ncbi:hypothetical protein SDC9_157673 [bioreactor metagenome]|uniref:Uncharacterized protein n=1 Tax=bioreactor metagenome TaxID=1076179 RepID=A0A645F7N2_9ZZZZ
MMMLFAFFILISFYFENKKYWSLSGSLVCLFLFVAMNMVQHIKTMRSNQIVVFADRKHSHIDFISQKYHQLMTNDSLVAEKIAGRFWKSRKLHQPDFIQLDRSYFKQFMGKKCLILVDDFLDGKRTLHPISIDLLIIGNALKPDSEELLNCVKPKWCVTDQTISAWYMEKLKEACRKRKIKFYAVSKEGAYICDLKRP